MKKLTLILLFLPLFTFGQVPSATVAFHATVMPQKINLHLHNIYNDADDIRRGRKAVIFGTFLNVSGAALAILAPKFSTDAKTVKIIRYSGIGLGVTGFAFNIPGIFVLSKNRNKYY